jgi:hypothetical protein
MVMDLGAKDLGAKDLGAMDAKDWGAWRLHPASGCDRGMPA